MEGLRCHSWAADHPGMVETVQFEAPTLLYETLWWTDASKIGALTGRLEWGNNYDTIKWEETCKEIGSSYVNQSPAGSSFSPVAARVDNPMSLGWALKSTGKSVGFIENFKVCINKTFMEGEDTARTAYRN